MPIQRILRRFRSESPVAFALVAVLLLITVPGAALGQGATPGASPVSGEPPCVPGDGALESLPETKLFIEYNATDGDVGVHGMFDSDGFTVMCLFDPSGTEILRFDPRGQMQDLGMGSLFTESHEPPVEQFSFPELEALFPEGDYTLRGTLFDGTGVEGNARFTHDVPAPPTIVSPQLAVDEESAGDVVVPTSGVVIQWEAVTETVDGGTVNITGYQVIVTMVEYEDSHGLSLPVFDVHLPPNRNSLTVSNEFLEPDTLYELEVLALEESGNQTISLGFFTTEA